MKPPGFAEFLWLYFIGLPNPSNPESLLQSGQRQDFIPLDGRQKLVNLFHDGRDRRSIDAADAGDRRDGNSQNSEHR